MTPSTPVSRDRGEVAPKARGEVAPRDRGEVASKARGEVAPRERGEVAPRDPVLRGGVETAPSMPDDGPRTVTEAREAIAATRERLSRTGDLLKQKLDLEKGRLGRRLDLAAKLRRAIAGREALAAAGAFAAGLLLALAGRKKRLHRDDIDALRDWSKHRERVLAALEDED